MSELDAQAAGFGARMAARGYSPEQVEALVRAAQPALEEARTLVDDGVDPDDIEFTLVDQ